MRGKKVLAAMLCAAMVSTNMGMISMASVTENGEQMIAISQKDESSETGQKSNYLKSMGRVASPSEPDEPATPSEATYVSTEEQLKEAVKHDGEIILENEISLTKPLSISGDVDITLEGGKITFSEDNGWQHGIKILSGASVALHDITIDATGIDYNETYNDSDVWPDYYTVWVAENAKITLMEGAEIIASDDENTLINPRKRGMWISGDCLMEGGIVSGFVDNGIAVSGNFTMTGGIITENGRGTKNWGGTGGLTITGKRSNRKEGRAYIEGGSITENEIGVFNNGYFEMNGGEIIENNFGLINNNRDAMTNEEFSPVAVLKSGEIADNSNYAIWNRYRGTVTIEDNMEISGQSRSDKRLRSMAVSGAAEKKSTMVIRNGEESTLKIEGGTITAYAANEIAVTNDTTSKLNMTGGEIIAAGEGSVAIQNTNTKAGDVVIAGGTLTTTGSGSQLLDNQGYIDFNENEVKFGGDASGKYFILTSHNEGGNVTPSSAIAEAGDIIPLKITPDDGYRISDVTVDGTSIGAISSRDLTVTGNHKVIVEFVKIQSGSGSSGGSSSGSSRSSAVSSTQTIPETPGSWIQDQAGWKFINGSVPYSNIWIRKNNAWYWIGEDGYMKTGWNLISEKWYYLTPVSGEMKTGWIADGGNWYYADETGARVTGWIKTGEKWYYLNADGKMAFNTTTPDGYRVDENGAMIG